MLYRAYDNGRSYEGVPPDYVPQSGDVMFDEPPTQEQLRAAFPNSPALHNVDIQRQILELESKITPRRLREAITGTDHGWLANVESQIAALRADRLVTKA